MKKNGIYDPEGKYKNPLTGKAYTREYFDKVDNWRHLEVYKNRDLILEKMAKCRVLIAEAGTGTGKTVIFPKLAMHYGNYQNRVLVTIPRTQLVISAVQWAAITMNIPHGEDGTPLDGDIIGYKFRGSDEFDADANENTKLTFATDGKAITMIKKNPSFDNYDFVIIDEIHERSVNIDIILLLLKNALRLNPNLKLILMSATMPKDIFQDYYREFGIEEIKILAKSNYPVEIKYPLKIDKIKNADLVEKTFEFFQNKLTNELRDKKSILFFMTVSKKIAELGEMIEKKYPHFKVFKITRTTADLYAEAVDKSIEDLSMDEGKIYDKKIIISTPVWESSKTIKGLEVVVDNGYEWNVSFNIEEIVGIMKNSLISQGQAIQRTGRVGRNSPGLCYRLFSEKTYHTMLANPIPPILNTDILSDIFGLTLLISNPTLSRLKNKIDELIQPPSNNAQRIYLRWLYDLGYFESWTSDSLLSDEGKSALNMRGTDVFLMREALIKSAKYSCIVEMSIMTAIIDTFSKDKDKELVNFFNIPSNVIDKDYFINLKLEKFKHPYGTLFSVYKATNIFFKHIYKNQSDNLEKFVKKNNLNYFLFREIIGKASDIINKIPRHIKKENLDDLDKVDDRVLLCLLNAFFCNISIKDKKGYTNLYPQKKSSFKLKGFDSNYIIYINFIKLGGIELINNPIVVPYKVFKHLPNSKKYFAIKRRTIKV